MAAARPSILVVDDDPSFRNVLDMRLQQWGYRVRVAQDAREAEDIAREWRPDLVLSDVVMPAMTGIELAEQIAARRPELPVLLATGFSEHLAGFAGAFTVVSKPYDATSLGRAISGLIGRGES